MKTDVEKLKMHASAMKYREEDLRKEIDTAQVKLDTTMKERIAFEQFIYVNFEKEGKP